MAEKINTEPTVAKVHTPKQLPSKVQHAIVDGYRSGTSMKELARVFGFIGPPFVQHWIVNMLPSGIT
jgi:hypothetical protein